MKPVCSKGMLLGQELGLADARLCPVRTRSSVFRWYPQAFALSQLPCGASRDGQLEKSLPLTIHCTSNQASLFFFFPLCLAIPCVRNSTMIYRTKKKKVSFLMLLSHLFLSSYFCRKIGHTVIALKQNLSAIRFSLLYKFLQYLTASVAYPVFLKYSVRWINKCMFMDYWEMLSCAGVWDKPTFSEVVRQQYHNVYTSQQVCVASPQGMLEIFLEDEDGLWDLSIDA